MFGKKYNQSHVDKLNGQIDKAHERITTLEEVIRGHEDLTLEVKWLKALVNDDEAICELLDAATQKQVVKTEYVHVDDQRNMQADQAYRMQQQGIDAISGSQMAGIYGLGQQRINRFN